jgi:thiol:disulfide interchange protein
MLALMMALVILGIGAWVYGRFVLQAKTASSGWVATAISVALIGVSIIVAWPRTMSEGAMSAASAKTVAGQQTKTAWQPYDKVKLTQLVAEGKPVFVDFTAAWCVSCQFNKRVALNTDAVAEQMKVLGITPMRADWTNYDPTITAALAELGRNALPVYALYSKGNMKPVLLPEVLTRSIVLDAFAEHVGGPNAVPAKVAEK